MRTHDEIRERMEGAIVGLKEEIMVLKGAIKIPR